MAIGILDRRRVLKAKRAFSTRRVPTKDLETVLSGDIRPAPGDLVLATVHQLGKHRRIELRSGRRARLLPGDEIIVAYGNRYASDQFEALVGEDLGGCDLVAAGGIAAKEVCRHERMLPPTWIVPVGLIGNAKGYRVNLANYAIRLSGLARPIKSVLVVGTGMNAGKTYSAASVVYGLKARGKRVAGIKVTGTGAGGDLWHYRDLGADVVYDFTDAGFASTYKVAVEKLEEAALTLIGQASRANCSHAVVEIADGLQQAETAALLRSQRLRRAVDGVVFASYDAMGAQQGVEVLRSLGHKVLAVSGQLCRSPLAMREAAQALDVPVRHPEELQQGVLFDSPPMPAPEIHLGDRSLTSSIVHIPRYGRSRNDNAGFSRAYRVHSPPWPGYASMEDDDGEIDGIEGA